MDRSPNTHVEIIQLAGNAADIERRGREIESLGDQMQAAADLLDDIELGAETRGKSLDAIKDVVGDAAGDLRTAGERYKPSGTVLLRYGDTLGTVQRTIDTLLPELEELWTAYTTEQSNYEADSQLPDPEPGESTADRTSWRDVQDKRSLWAERAVDYEAAYSTWWTAYEDARKGIKGANDDGVEDNWVDNNLDFLDLVLDVLSVAGIVLAVVACIIGGPFILLAALVGLAALGLTILKVAGGHGNGMDIAMAAIGVFPFGKAAGLFKGAGKLATLKGMAGDVVGAGWKNGSTVSTVLTKGTAGQVFTRGGTLNKHGSAVMQNFFKGVDGTPSALSRLYRGTEGAYGHMLSDAASGLSNKAKGNLNQFLNNTPGGTIVQDMVTSPATSGALDFFDNLGKAGIGFAYDRKDDFGFTRG